MVNFHFCVPTVRYYRKRHAHSSCIPGRHIPYYNYVCIICLYRGHVCVCIYAYSTVFHRIGPSNIYHAWLILFPADSLFWCKTFAVFLWLPDSKLRTLACSTQLKVCHFLVIDSSHAPALIALHRLRAKNCTMPPFIEAQCNASMDTCLHWLCRCVCTVYTIARVGVYTWVCMCYIYIYNYIYAIEVTN